MDTREGIYIGGHEIVRRYVGDKIIWRKGFYSARFIRSAEIIVRDSDGLSLIFSVAQSFGNQAFTGFFSNGKIKLNNTEVLFSKIQGGVYDNSIRGNFNHIKVTFFSQDDKNKFAKQNYSAADITIFEKLYR